uniref:hypothetical protein n=1 Tax=Psychrobacter sp. DAB_AL43B TaxID=1028416 RepID=UPI000259F7D0|nr:hypothetical protein [Psychrobacter sp. DAB_AL43B]AFH75089.1 hypothetical protein [Psychrobacter sp. DAB_AL43B]
MSYLTVRLFKGTLHYAAVFLPLFLIGCATMGEKKTESSSEQSFAEAYEVDAGVIRRSAIAPSTIATTWVIMDPPLRSPTVTFFDTTIGEDATKSWAQLDSQHILKLLSNTRSEISVAKLDDDGTLDYLVAKVTAARGRYKVIMDYTPYIVEDAIDEDGDLIGYARVGVGLRLTANITTNKAGINLGSLMSLGVAAKLNQLQGTMHIDTIGIRLKDNSGMILLNTAIDESSILKTLESMAVVQSKIADVDTHLDPQVLWVKPIDSSFEPDKVAQVMNQPKVSDGE